MTNITTSAAALIAYQNATTLEEQMAAIAAGIRNAEGLSDLMEWLETANEPRIIAELDIHADGADELIERHRNLRHSLPMEDLPTFGPEPEDTVGRWSWDATHFLVGEDWDWTLEERDDIDEEDSDDAAAEEAIHECRR